MGRKAHQEKLQNGKSKHAYENLVCGMGFDENGKSLRQSLAGKCVKNKYGEDENGKSLQHIRIGNTLVDKYGRDENGKSIFHKALAQRRQVIKEREIEQGIYKRQKRTANNAETLKGIHGVDDEGKSNFHSLISKVRWERYKRLGIEVKGRSTK
eukprot:UN34341